jgi:hypothetical protein
MAAFQDADDKLGGESDKNMSKKAYEYPWSNFDAKRTQKAHGDIRSLLDNLINFAVPYMSTHFDSIHQIGARAMRPFRIKFLSEELKKGYSIRGNTFIGNAADKIDMILDSYPSMCWWMDSDGLVVDEVKPAIRPISAFDRIAGPLVVKHRKNGRLLDSSLSAIAAVLDAEGFKLKKFLEPAQLKPISAYNELHPRSAIKTFAKAAAHPKFVRSIRQRLCRAQARYHEFLRASEPSL